MKQIKKYLIFSILILMAIVMLACDRTFHVINFNSQGGSAIDSIFVPHDDNVITELPVPTFSGMEFIGWHFSNDEKVELPLVVTTSKTLNAWWQPLAETFIVTFDGANSSIIQVTVGSGNTVNRPANPTREGYVFVNWLLNGEVFNFNTPITNNITLVAQWQPAGEIFTVSFDSQGGSNVNSVTANANTTITRPTDPSKYGHRFIGWFLNDEVFNFNTPIVTSITLIAQWEVITVVTLEFDSMGGSEIENIVSYAGVNLPTLPRPVKDGYIFAGWFTNTYFSERFINHTIDQDTRLFARWVIEVTIDGVTSGAFIEAIWAQWPDQNPHNAIVYYSISGHDNWQPVDAPLVRAANGVGFGRVDVVGLRSEFYDLRIINSIGQTILIQAIFTTAHMREGYAHFNYDYGVGAYNNDGTLKDNALVVYITNDNKNTVTVPGLPQVGIGWILNNHQYQSAGGGASDPNTSNGLFSMNETLAAFNRPISFRFLGTVTVPEGLTAWNSRDRGGTPGENGDMARIRDGNNITIGGIGYDAVIYGWGVQLISSREGRGRSFEVRNLTFTQYSEDAVSMEGSTRPGYTAERGWFHNNTFFAGFHPNPAESDKALGDGALDFRRGRFFTVSFNQFFNTDKTGLVGGHDQDLTWHVTFHHNHYRNSRSRTPLARAANIHMFNNFFEMSNDYTGQQSSAIDARRGAFIFTEANYFLGLGTNNNHVGRVQHNSVILSYNDVFVSTTGTEAFTPLNNRTQGINSVNRYPNFHINPDVFYFNPATGQTDVRGLTCAVQARADVTAYAGVFRNYQSVSTLQPITNIEPTTIDDDLVINDIRLDMRPTNNNPPLKVIRLLTRSTVTINHTSGLAPHVVDIYGRLFMAGAGTITLDPGVYVIKSSRAFGRPSEARESRIGINITVDREEIRQARLQRALDAIEVLDNATIVYNNASLALIREAQSAINDLENDQIGLVNQMIVTNAFNTYISLGQIHIQNLINNIGTVNQGSLNVIQAAQTAWNNAIIEVRNEVNNFNVLAQAWVSFSDFHVQSIIDLINDLEDVNQINYDDFHAIESAQKAFINAFNAFYELSEEQQLLVTNKDILFNGLARIEVLLLPYDLIERIKELESIINNGGINIAHADLVDEANEIYALLTINQQALITSAQRLVLDEATTIIADIRSALVVQVFTTTTTNNFFTTIGRAPTFNVNPPVIVDGTELRQGLHLDSQTTMTFQIPTNWARIEIRLSGESGRDTGVSINGQAVQQNEHFYVIHYVYAPTNITLARIGSGGARVVYIRVSMQNR